MITVNKHYEKLEASYLFSKISRYVAEYQEKHPHRRLIRLGIGDATQALPPAVVSAFHRAVEELGDDATFRGYGPEQGYQFLREAIARHDFIDRNAPIVADEIFISDGAKCDSANFQELFDIDTKIAVTDPVYPVYVDSNVMAGRTGKWNGSGYDGIVYLPATPENHFVSTPPDAPADIAYLCFPNNPTGATIDRAELTRWVDWARENRALIIYDAAYCAFIRDPSLPQSIYEIAGATEVAVELRSFSKTAGFTGTRCAYTVVPKKCRAWSHSGEIVSLHQLWMRRCSTKFNGVSYPAQRAAEAVYSSEGRRQVAELTDYYLENAKLIGAALDDIGYRYSGGTHSPYLWVDINGESSWDFFHRLLELTGVISTPGSGFGSQGEGFIRLSAFNHRDEVQEAIRRFRERL